MIILETDKDRVLEARAIERFCQITHTEPEKLPPLSAMDYLIKDFGDIRFGIEIKTRKETVEQVKKYGGLILKYRKYEELLHIGGLLNIPTYVLFAFENSEGDLLLLNVEDIQNPEPKDPPVRRNFRGLATDEEPVLYVDWELLCQVKPDSI